MAHNSRNADHGWTIQERQQAATDAAHARNGTLDIQVFDITYRDGRTAKRDAPTLDGRNELLTQELDADHLVSSFSSYWIVRNTDEDCTD